MTFGADKAGKTEQEDYLLLEQPIVGLLQTSKFLHGYGWNDFFHVFCYQMA